MHYWVSSAKSLSGNGDTYQRLGGVMGLFACKKNEEEENYYHGRGCLEKIQVYLKVGCHKANNFENLDWYGFHLQGVWVCLLSGCKHSLDVTSQRVTGIFGPQCKECLGNQPYMVHDLQPIKSGQDCSF